MRQQLAATKTLHDRERQANRACDTLRITIASVADQRGAYFQVTLQRPDLAAIGGPFRRPAAIRAVDVQALRRRYDQQLRMLHELAAVGDPVPPPNMQGLVDLGRRVATVLPQTARQGIVAAVQQAQRSKRGLRVVIEVTPDAAAKQLLGLPWELMVLPLTRGAQTDSGGEGFLLLNAGITLARQVQGIGRNTAPQLS